MTEENQNEHTEGNAGAGENQEGKDTSADKAAGADASLLDFDNIDSGNTGGRPEYIPEEAWDAEKGEAIADKVMEELARQSKIAKDLRAKMGRGEHKPPEKAEDYKLPTFEEADAKAGELLKADDPFVKGLTGVALEAGLSQGQFETFMGKASKMLAERVGELEADAGREMTDEERTAHREREFAKIGPNGPRIANAVAAHFKMLADQGHFDEDELEELKATASSAAGLRLLNKLRSLTGGESIPMGDSVNVDGLPSDKEIYAMIGSDEYNDTNNPKHAAIHEKVDRFMTMRQAAGRPERLQV